MWWKTQGKIPWPLKDSLKNIKQHDWRSKVEIHETSEEYENQQLFNCVLGSSSFKTKIQFHIKRKQYNKVYKCEICQYEANRPVQVKEHIQINYKGKLFSCDDCWFSTESEQLLLDHIKTNDPNFKALECPECEYNHFRKLVLNNHINVRQRGNLHKCNFKANG